MTNTPNTAAARTNTNTTVSVDAAYQKTLNANPGRYVGSHSYGVHNSQWTTKPVPR